MAADLQPKTPSPEFIAVFAWALNNLWAGACALLVILGRIVFGNIAKEIAEIKKQNEIQNHKLDTAIGVMTDLGREVSEIKGELKAKEKR